VCIKAESELVGLTKRVRGLEEDFETTESRLLNTSTKLEEASKASDENERYYIFIFTAIGIFFIHSESKKLCHYTFVHNFDKSWPIFKILSLLYSSRNLQQNPCYTVHYTLDVLLHYLAKDKRPKLAKFCYI